MAEITREELLLDNYPQAQAAFVRLSDPSQRQQAMDFFANMAGTFTDNAINSFNQILEGEMDAKKLGAISIMMGAREAMATCTFGIPGVGKSLFDKHLPLIVKGVDEGQVARIYPRADMSAAELVGKILPMEKRLIGPNGEESIEEYVARVKSLINPKTGYVVIDDGQRVNPKALEATLKLVQDGYITTYEDGYPIKTKNMRLIKINYNDFGAMYSWSFPPHFAHRIANGVEMGRGAKIGEPSDIEVAIVNDDDDERLLNQNVTEQISDDNADILSNVVRYVQLSEQAKKLILLSSAEIIYTLRQGKVKLGGPRTTRQVKRTAKALALSNYRTSVQPKDVLDAFEYGATAKYGSTGVGEVGTDIDDPFSIEHLVLRGAERIFRSA